MKDRFVLEDIQRIYDFDSNMYMELGPDDDGLDMLQLSCYDENKKCYTKITFVPEQLTLLKQAIVKLGY